LINKLKRIGDIKRSYYRTTFIILRELEYWLTNLKVCLRRKIQIINIVLTFS